MPCLLRLFFHLVALLELCFASVYTVTVDDSGPDPLTGAVMHYSSSWNYGPNCTTCATHPSAPSTHNSTWHDATYDPHRSDINIPQNITFSFVGVYR